MKRDFIKFVLKVSLVHVLTYVACGMISMLLFDYQSTLSQAGMRDTNSLIVGLSPLFQIFRGILFGVALWLFKGSFIDRKNGWLTLWAIIAIIGIFNTPATSPGSIEYFIYYEPVEGMWNLEIGGMIEVLVQTFLFSFLSFHIVKPRKK